ncbi:hypothetical protein F5878DRAFT_647459 [Lentinula raphanica]|uniref:Uncharacterized protein n=1 Tax=Lentinula raphanica TaxID=153919 RepID=A0AA38U4X0_9AGAR|nr:hypothetical protein F5878DRAFT_647459 [Lentinula raphanica]
MCGEWKDSTFRNPRNVVSYASCCCFTEIDLDGVYSFSVNSGGFGQLVAEYSCKTHFKFPLGDASLSEDVFINFIDVDPSMLTTIWLAPPSSSQLQATLASPRFILSRYDNSDPSPISSSLAELKGRDTPCQGFIYLGQRTPPYGLLVPGDSARQPTLKVLMSGYSRAFSFIETIVGKSEVHDPLIAVQPFATSFSAFLMLSTIFQTIPYSPRANFCTGVGTLTLTESRLRCRSCTSQLELNLRNEKESRWLFLCIIATTEELILRLEVVSIGLHQETGPQKIFTKFLKVWQNIVKFTNINEYYEISKVI